MKILYVTTAGSTMGFFKSLITELIHQGHQVDLAANEQIFKTPEFFSSIGCKKFHLSCTRSPVNKGNLTAIKELRKIVNEGGYDIVHCHTPIAAACTRLACKSIRKQGMKVIYTAHGFHFYNGAPLMNWIIYYPMERWLSRYTDVLITINQQDYKRATDRFHAKTTIYVPGVGIDLKKYNEDYDGQRIRDEFHIGSKFMLLSAGELNKNKNHEIVIRALAKIDHSNIIYVIAGVGPLKEYLENLAKEQGVHLILAGWRADMVDIYAAANAYIMPSLREGLSVSLMEAMACGVPCLAGRIRGNMDLIDEKGGYLFDPRSQEAVRGAIEDMMKNNNNDALIAHSKEKIKKFSIDHVNELMMSIYREATQSK